MLYIICYIDLMQKLSDTQFRLQTFQWLIFCFQLRHSMWTCVNVVTFFLQKALPRHANAMASRLFCPSFECALFEGARATSGRINPKHSSMGSAISWGFASQGRLYRHHRGNRRWSYCGEGQGHAGQLSCNSIKNLRPWFSWWEFYWVRSGNHDWTATSHNCGDRRQTLPKQEACRRLQPRDGQNSSWFPRIS